jgi:hypothetical protein
VLVVVGLIGVLGNIWLVFLIKYNKDLQVHPMKLIMAISFVDAYMNLNMVANSDICSYGQQKLFARTVLFDSGPVAEYTSLYLLYNISNASDVFLLFVTILLNTFLALDLILMIRLPFKSKESLYTIYLTSSVLISATLSVSYMLIGRIEWSQEYQ